MTDQEFRFGFRFIPGSAVQEAQAEARRISEIFLRMGQELSANGPLDPAAARRFGEELGRAIQKALAQDIRQSPLMQRLTSAGVPGVSSYRDTAKLISGTETTGTSALLAEKIRVAQAELAAKEAARRSAVPLGQTRAVPGFGDVQGYKTAMERTLAQMRTIAGVETANRALEKAEERYTADINKAAAEQRKLNDAVARRAAADQAKNFQVSFPTADTGTHLGRSQERFNRAEEALAVANLRQARVHEAETRTSEQVIAADGAVRSATTALAAAREQVRIEEIRAGEAARKAAAAANAQASAQQRSGFGQKFALGFQGVADKPYAEQLGQAFKFSLFYGTAYKLLFALTQTFQQTLQEGIAFQNEVSNLQLATGRTREAAEDLANQVGKEATQYGFAASQGVQIAAKAQGYYGTTGADRATQESVAMISAKVVDQIAFASGKQPAEIQGNLAAITQAYGLGYQSQTYIGDLDAYFSKRFGADPGATIGAISQSGTVGRAAGFSPAEVGAIAADIMARTGATESAAGGYMAQIFSRAGEGSLTKLSAQYDIDPNASLAKQMKELAKIYKERPDQQDEISAVAGRGKVQNAFIALLQDYAEVQDAAKDATKDAGGALGRSTDLRLDNIGGQIQETIGSLRLFATELSESGFLDVIGAAVVAFRELVEAGTSVLEAWNQIPHAVRDVLIGLALLATATKYSAATQGGASLLGRAGIFKAEGAFSSLATREVMPAGRYASTAAGGVTPLSAGRAGLATGAAGLARLGGLAAEMGPAIAVLGSVYLWSEVRRSAEQYSEANKSYISALKSHEENLTTPEGLLSRASTFEELARSQRDAADQRFSAFNGDKDNAENQSAAAKAEAERLKTAADYLQSKAENDDTKTALISGFDADSLQRSMDAITASGGTAKQQFDALSSAINDSTDAARRAAAQFDAKEVAPGAATDLYAAYTKDPGFKVPKEDLDFWRNGPNFEGLAVGAARATGLIDGEKTTQGILSDAIDTTELQKRFQDQLSQLSSLADLDPETIDKMAKEIVGDTPQKIIDTPGSGKDQGDLKEITDGMLAQATAVLQGLADGVIGVGEVVTLTQTQLTANTQKALETSKAVLDSLPQTAHTDRIAQAKAGLQTIIAQIQASPTGASPQSLLDLQTAQNTLAQSQYDQLDAMQKAAQAGVTNKNQLGAISRAYATQKIGVAVKQNDPDLLAKIISESGESAIGEARAAVLAAEKADKAAQRVARKSARIAAAASAALKGFTDNISSALSDFFGGGDGGLRELLGGPGQTPAEAANAAAAAAKPNIKKPDRSGLLEAINTTAYNPGADGGITDSASSIAVARRNAEALRDQGDIAGARAAIFEAKTAMDEAAEGSVEYYNALGQYYQARQALSDAIISYRQNLYLLSHDITNPLDQARAAVRAAAQKLAADRGSGAGPDAIAADQIALQQSQADAESTAFQQRLEAVQTADDLGRISHQKYMNYLEHEHDRLSAIKNRTYQQQEELDQIDQLMKSAAESMSAQWNFGDIKLPTPYQMRRYIEERMDSLAGGNSNGHGYQGGSSLAPEWLGQGPRRESTTTQYNTFEINGADTAKVKKIITEVVGGSGTIHTRTTGARRGRR